MFTGLIREIGNIKGLARQGGVTRVDIVAPQMADGLALGDSLAVNGICLTITARRGPLVSVEAAAETRRITTLPRWRRGEPVHLEPALRIGDGLDGHLVLGHVDGVGRIARLRHAGGSLFMTVSLPSPLSAFLMPKGSVAVDGVSLTVDAGPFTDRFTVNLIPHTLQTTRFGRLRTGQAVNLEMDALVKAARTGGGLAALDSVPAATTTNQRPGSLQADDLFARGWRRRTR